LITSATTEAFASAV